MTTGAPRVQDVVGCGLEAAGKASGSREGYFWFGPFSIFDYRDILRSVHFPYLTTGAQGLHDVVSRGLEAAVSHGLEAAG